MSEETKNESKGSKDISKQYCNIVKLTYGACGLVTFLQKIFRNT